MKNENRENNGLQIIEVEAQEAEAFTIIVQDLLLVNLVLLHGEILTLQMTIMKKLRKIVRLKLALHLEEEEVEEDLSQEDPHVEALFPVLVLNNRLLCKLLEILLKIY
jgi:hypothetical protein